MPMHFVEAPNNFYLGARVDPDTHEVLSDDVIYYDARDLTTHAVILGMTGSGKTGLGITLLEEATIDGIPSLIIDPKGDITNMLLAFPDLEPEYFQPWVDPEAALREDQTIEEYAQTIAKRWREGLAEWGIDNDRIQDYRRAARFSIYTPGSEAGLPMSILQSFAAPQEGWAGNEEALRERIAGMVTAILALIGIEAKPVESREHVLLSNIFEYNWRNNTDLSMEQLILQVQQPPFGKLGVLDVNIVFPEKDRHKLAQTLNNIIAAPNFQSWLRGEPIDVPSLLFTPEGYPRTTIIYVAHLNDAERQFIITLVLEAILSWLRTLSGSTSLRALFYIDEVFGLFPPHPYNPPTKSPILRLLKQGRAYGTGLIVATQNPKDIDYKGLSNAGTWFIGKLQTDIDRQRVLEGLDSARDATSMLDIRTVDRLIGRLAPREFIMHNVHEPTTPILMKTRWTMSYLRGPLTRQQISELMANQRGLYQAPPAQPSRQPASSGAIPQQPGAFGPSASLVSPPTPAMPPTYSGAGAGYAHAPAQLPREEEKEGPPPGFSALPPALPSSVRQYYLPTEYAPEQAIRNWEASTRQMASSVGERRQLLYQPSLLAQAMVRFTHSRTNIAETYTYAFVVPNLPRVPVLEWSKYVSEPFDPHVLDSEPSGKAYYGDIPQVFSSTGFTELRNNLVDWIYHNAALYAYYNPVLDMYSAVGEDRRAFVARLQAVARERRDAEVDAVAARYDKKLAALEERYQRRARRREAEQAELADRKREEMLTAGESLWQLMKGRAYYTLSRTSRMRRYTTMSQSQLESIEYEMEQIRAEFEETEREMQEALQAVQDKWVNALQQIEEIRISPYKKDINLVLFGIGWVPYWEVIVNGTPTILPASSSGLAYAQHIGAYGDGGGLARWGG